MPDSINRRKDDTEIALVAQDVGYLIKQVDKINDKLEHDYVTQDQFDPVRKIVYGLVGTILLAVISAILAITLR